MNTENETRAIIAAGLAAGMLLATSLAGAAALPGIRIHDLDPRQVKYCRLAGNVTGAYDWSNSTSPDTTEHAKTQARGRAAAMGATNILWTHMSSSYSSAGTGRAEVAGQAYICRRPLPLP